MSSKLLLNVDYVIEGSVGFYKFFANTCIIFDIPIAKSYYCVYMHDVHFLQMHVDNLLLLDAVNVIIVV